MKNVYTHDDSLGRSLVATAVLCLIVLVGYWAQRKLPVPNTYDAARQQIEKETSPQVEALLTKTTGKPAKCTLSPTLWAVLIPGVKFEGMIACKTGDVTYHARVSVTRYADDDGQMFWEIGDLQRTEPQPHP